MGPVLFFQESVDFLGLPSFIGEILVGPEELKRIAEVEFSAIVSFTEYAGSQLRIQLRNKIGDVPKGDTLEL